MARAPVIDADGHVVERLEDVPYGAVVLLDEAYITYHARGSMSGEGRTIGQPDHRSGRQSDGPAEVDLWDLVNT